MPDVLRDAGGIDKIHRPLGARNTASLRLSAISCVQGSGGTPAAVGAGPVARGADMNLRQAITAALVLGLCTGTVASARAQAGAETFTATASVKTADGAAASAPVTIVIERKMSDAEASGLIGAFKTGGAAAFRKALAGVPATGSVQIGSGAATPARVAIERTTDKGRLLTIVTDKPILFLGAGMAGAKPKEGYDFAVLDIEVDAKGVGAGTLSPAARVAVKQGAFVVDDYASEVIRLTDVKKVK